MNLMVVNWTPVWLLLLFLFDRGLPDSVPDHAVCDWHPYGVYGTLPGSVRQCWGSESLEGLTLIPRSVCGSHMHFTVEYKSCMLNPTSPRKAKNWWVHTLINLHWTLNPVFVQNAREMRFNFIHLTGYNYSMLKVVFSDYFNGSLFWFVS